METTLTTIVASCVLHNLAIIANEEEPPSDPEIVLPPEVNEIHLGDNVGIFNNENTAVRTALIRTHFVVYKQVWRQWATRFWKQTLVEVPYGLQIS